MTTTLLAVDDSKTMRRVLEITFAGEDYRVVVADSSQDALAKLQAERPAIALIDARIGDDSGYDLAQRIKGDSPGTRVVILSSKHQPYDRGRGSSAGVDDFIDKPFDTQQLIDKVAALARKVAEAPAAAEGAPAAAQTPYRSVPQPAPQPQSAFAQRPRSPTLSYGTPSPAPEPAPAAAPAAARSGSGTMPGTASPAPAPIAPTPVTGVQLPREAPAPAPAPAPRPAVPAAVPAGNGQQFTEKLAALGLTKAQIEGVLALSREVVEQVVWEVVPQLAETMIQEEIRRLTNE